MKILRCQWEGCNNKATRALVIQQVAVVDVCIKHYNEANGLPKKKAKRKKK